MNRMLLTSMVLAASWPAWASAESQILDKAKMFSDEAVQSADRSFKEFQKRTRMDVALETIPNLQEADPRITSELGSAEADKLLEKYCKDRAASKGVHGLYIVLCRDPAKLKYQASRNSISQQDTKAVVDSLMSSLKKREFDQALSNAAGVLDRISAKSTTSSRTRSDRSDAPQSAGLGTLWTVLLIGIGVWLLFGLMRGLSSGGGGGGFMQSMLGGMFGGMMGMWMYDSFFRGGGGFSGGDGGYDGGSSGGGDWGDSGGSGGGDWGGGGDYGASGDF